MPLSSGFTERFKSLNGLDRLGFERWGFHPGMLFQARNQWWGMQAKRSQPHEGADFCLYGIKGGEIRCLNENTKIPVMFEGVIIKIGDDFLGKSVYVRHSPHDGQGNRLHTIYGHTKPGDGIYEGQTLSEGEVLGTVADARSRGNEILSHLHLTVAWIPETLPQAELDWKTIANPAVVSLLDPLSIIGGEYSIMENALSLVKGI